MRKTITIKIDYDKSTIRSEKNLEAALRDEIERRIGEGMLTPTTEEIVDSWSAVID